MGHVTLVLGGARSGKSAHAESLGKDHAGTRTYIATAELFDEEMRDRAAQHRIQRGEGWKTVEAPLDLVRTLIDEDAAGRFMLIDCITVWIGNLLHHEGDVGVEVARLCEALVASEGEVAIVANEVGLGIVPDNALARRFRDEAGRANQAIAAAADEVVFLAAGIPIILKGSKRAPK
ncbi:bifunctional adenosylcobinamide kinase/adenosylcobinamide-phosphate guanylyltransferase [soil metagenome]